MGCLPRESGALCLISRGADTTYIVGNTCTLPHRRWRQEEKSSATDRSRGQPGLHETLPQKENKLESPVVCLGTPNDYLKKRYLFNSVGSNRQPQVREMTRTEKKDGSALIGGAQPQHPDVLPASSSSSFHSGARGCASTPETPTVCGGMLF